MSGDKHSKDSRIRETDSLSDEQQRFIREYLVDFHVTHAALRAAYVLQECYKPKTYYVYALVDPLNQEIFYIGKGAERRYAMHEAAWKAQIVHNPHKHTRIGRIAAAGRRPVALCLDEGLSDKAAYAVESLFIKAIGLSRLTNLVPGQVSLKDKWQAWALEALQRLKSFDEWMCERPRSAVEQASYWRLVHEIRAMAERKLETTRTIQVNDHIRCTISYEG